MDPGDCPKGGEHDFSDEMETVSDGEIVGTDYACSKCGAGIDDAIMSAHAFHPVDRVGLVKAILAKFHQSDFTEAQKSESDDWFLDQMSTTFEELDARCTESEREGLFEHEWFEGFSIRCWNLAIKAGKADASNHPYSELS